MTEKWLITWCGVDVEAFVKDEILGRFPDHKYVLFSFSQAFDEKEGHGRIWALKIRCLFAECLLPSTTTS